MSLFKIIYEVSFIVFMLIASCVNIFVIYAYSINDQMIKDRTYFMHIISLVLCLTIAVYLIRSFVKQRTNGSVGGQTVFPPTESDANKPH